MKTHRIITLAVFAFLLCSSTVFAQTFFTTLSGSNEPDGGDPDGSGIAAVQINGNTIGWMVTAYNLSTITGTHIHRISSGGNVVISFAPSGQSAPTFTNNLTMSSLTVSDASSIAILNEIVANPTNFYVNVHSNEKPNGAIRGSLARLSAGGTGNFTTENPSTCVQSDTAMCLNSSRFKVEATWSTPTQSGAGHAVRLTADSGYFWFFNSANIEMDVKVLNACTPFNSQWVFASGLTNVQVNLKVTDTMTGIIRTYTNPNGTAFLPIQDTGAFACP